MANAVSLNPESFIEGSGLIDDVDLVWNECRFVMFDFNGKSPEPAPCLLVKMDHDGDGLEQYYSMGSSKDWLPSDDGKQLLAVGSASSIRTSSNGGLLLMSLVESGFPADDLGEDISVLDGVEVHMIQAPAPERKGLKKSPEQVAREEKYGPPTILLVSNINAMPGEKKTPKGKTKPAAAKGKPAAAKGRAKDDSGDVEGEATAAILAILEADGSIEKSKLPQRIFKDFKDNPLKNDMVKVVFKDDFLNAGPWTYEDGVVTG